MENMALVEEITTNGLTQIGEVSAKEKYLLTFDVDGTATVKINLIDTATGEFRRRVNKALYYKDGTYTYSVSSPASAYVSFDVSSLDGYISNIILERTNSK